MFIGHIPAGYLCTKVLQKFLIPKNITDGKKKWILYAGIISSIFPDFDMLYFNFIDGMKYLHHGYWTHLPVFWLLIFIVWFALSFVIRGDLFRIYGYVISVNVFLHLFLDTIVGKIRWFYPFSNYDVVFFHVPSIYKWWVWNFVFHWTFLFEVSLVICALFVIVKNYDVFKRSPNSEGIQNKKSASI